MKVEACSHCTYLLGHCCTRKAVEKFRRNMVSWLEWTNSIDRSVQNTYKSYSLTWRYSSCRLTRCASSGGMLPVSKLPPSLNTSISSKYPNSGGIGPYNSLSVKSRVSDFDFRVEKRHKMCTEAKNRRMNAFLLTK